uniref:LisH domain-containing protein n=1 Tax=Trichobilharzia regenti TaxID=157069 RepID=A0AA85JC38_TRIRE|nr:unnamed protein product [Trichobilharzia regenti]
MDGFDGMTDEEIHLKEALIRSLNEEGILPKIQAQLKAAVYLALEKHNYAEGLSSLNQSTRAFWSTENGLIIASLLVDFMTVMKLENTLNVLKHEAQMEQIRLLDSDTLTSLLPVGRTSENSSVLLSMVETLKNIRSSKMNDTDSSSTSNNSRKRLSRIPVLQNRVTSSRSQASEETLYNTSRRGDKSSNTNEYAKIHQESSFQEPVNNCSNRLQMRSPTHGPRKFCAPQVQTHQYREILASLNPLEVRVYAPVKKQSPINDDKSDVDDDDDIEEVLKTEESVADDAVDQTVDSEQSLGLDYVEEVQSSLNPVLPTRLVQ